MSTHVRVNCGENYNSSILSFLCVLTTRDRSGVVYNFGCVCVFVCQTVQTITFENLDVISCSFSHILYMSREYGSRSYMKVIGSRSRSHDKVTGANCESHVRNSQILFLSFGLCRFEI